MLSWLRNRPTSVRKPARSAVPGPQPVRPAPVPQTEPEPSIEAREMAAVAEEEMPPPFFADGDTAFLDLGEVTRPAAERLTPPPLPQVDVQVPIEPEPISATAELADALQSLPPWPPKDAPDRTKQLLDILRQLDRIAGDVCDALETDRETESGLSLPRKPR